MQELKEVMQSAVKEISNLEAKIYQLEMQNEFLVHEFSNVRRILHAEKIISYDGYLMNIVAMIGKTLEESECETSSILNVIHG